MTDSSSNERFQPFSDHLQAVLRRIPEWLRQDFAGTDPAARDRAVETIAAMLALALQELPSAARGE